MMDVSGLSDAEIIALCRIMRLGVGKRSDGYQLEFVAKSGAVLNASFPATNLRDCFNKFGTFGVREITKYGQHPTTMPEINYP